MRRTILPKLRKKLKSESAEDGTKKRKRASRNGLQVFDPELHIKKEKSDDDSSTMNTSINTNDISTLTDAENYSYLVTEIKMFFKTDGTAVLTEDKFNELLRSDKSASPPISECTRSETVLATDTVTMCPQMPLLTDTLNEDNGSLEIISLTYNNTYKDTDDNNNIDSDNNNMVHTCKGGCKYSMVINENPYQDTLDNDYGPNLTCVKTGCELSLIQCFKLKDRGGGCAYICDGCKQQNCKNIYCVGCWMLVDTKEGKNTRRRSTRKL